MTEFREFLERHRGVLLSEQKENISLFMKIEAELNLTLPLDFKYFLTEYGYSHYCGVGHLDESIQLTMECRRHLNLPHKYFVLCDHGSGGLIIMDTASPEMKIINTEYDSVPDDINEEIVYPSFQSYLEELLDVQSLL